ncbi:hypothetical protein ACB094_08G045100 [Castanea mollissima]
MSTLSASLSLSLTLSLSLSSLWVHTLPLQSIHTTVILTHYLSAPLCTSLVIPLLCLALHNTTLIYRAQLGWLGLPPLPKHTHAHKINKNKNTKKQHTKKQKPFSHYYYKYEIAAHFLFQIQL